MNVFFSFIFTQKRRGSCSAPCKKSPSLMSGKIIIDKFAAAFMGGSQSLAVQLELGEVNPVSLELILATTEHACCESGGSVEMAGMARIEEGELNR